MYGILQRTADPTDRRRHIIAPAYATPIGDWLSGRASAWERVLRGLAPAERATVITALRA
ncbi:hypothetical protein [Streptomyces uncialis]|uniref:hypothetical protein n=1 Tax=Streptomyces uncialis TaxID=1048205 RepID=UPI0037A214EB